MGLLTRNRAVLDALRHDEGLAGPQSNGAVAHPDVEFALQHEEEIIGVVVLVPDEFAFHLHDHDVMAVEPGDRARREVIREGAKFLGKIDRVRHRRPLQTSIAAVTGTWSEGRSQPRACLAISKRETRSPSCGETQTWSSRRPRSAAFQLSCAR